MVGSALQALCLRRLGFDPAELSERELRLRLPAMIRAVQAEHAAANRRLSAQVVEVQKAALLRQFAYASFIPNGEFVRNETVPEWSDEAADPNAVLESILPNF